MGDEPSVSSRVSFSVFEADLRAGELRRNGSRVKLQELPFKILALLLEHPGEVVTREELQQKLWPADTFVDFEHGLNTAIMKLRTALGDGAHSPRFIETVGHRGYRFLAPITRNGAGAGAAIAAAAPVEAAPVPARARRLLLPAVGLAALVAVLLGANVGGVRDRVWPKDPAAPIRAIAVLPLENLSGDPNQEYFADGMTDALITELAKNGPLRVMSRTSVMRYKGTRRPLPEITRELNVDAVVEGSVVRSGEKVRITAQLIDSATGEHLWAESYERDARDILALQRELSADIAGRVAANVTAQAPRPPPRRVDPRAYDHYLRGQFHFNQWSAEGFKKGIDDFNQAIAIDPNYAAAHAGLANCYLMLGHWALFMMPKEAMPKGEAAAKRALELDETLAEGHIALASARVYQRDWAQAEKEFRRGLELSPGYALGRRWHASYLTVMGRIDEALAEQKRALELDPLSLSARWSLGAGYLYARRYDQAIEEGLKVVQMDPNFEAIHELLRDSYRLKGMCKESVAEHVIVMRMDESKELSEALARAYATGGCKGATRWVLEWRKSEARAGRGSPVWLAITYAQLGDKERALQWLEKAYEERRSYLAYLNVDPEFDPLRSDPRFQDLVRRVGLPQPATGSSPPGKLASSLAVTTAGPR